MPLSKVGGRALCFLGVCPSVFRASLVCPSVFRASLVSPSVFRASLVCPSVFRASLVLCMSINFYFVCHESLCTWWRNFSETCHKHSSCQWALLKRFARSEVNGQGCDETECYNSGSMHFNGVAPSLTCHSHPPHLHLPHNTQTHRLALT